MKKYIFWILLSLWIFVSGLCFIISNKYDDRVNKQVIEIQRALMQRYLQTGRMTFSDAFTYASWGDAYLYPDYGRKDKIINEYGVSESSLRYIDLMSEKKNKLNRGVYIPGRIIFALWVFWFFGFIGHIIVVTYRAIRKKLKNKRIAFIKSGLILIMLICVIVVIFKFDTKPDKHIIEFTNEYYAENDSYWDAIGGLIEISNGVYALYEVQEVNPFDRTAFLVKLQYLKKNVEILKEELKISSVKRIVEPVIQICDNLLEFVDLYSKPYSNTSEQQKNYAEAMGAFKAASDILFDYMNNKAIGWSPFTPTLLTIFNPNAIKKYKVLQTLPKGSKESVYLWFGYYVYNTIESNLPENRYESSFQKKIKPIIQSLKNT